MASSLTAPCSGLREVPAPRISYSPSLKWQLGFHSTSTRRYSVARHFSPPGKESDPFRRLQGGEFGMGADTDRVLRLWGNSRPMLGAAFALLLLFFTLLHFQPPSR